MPMPACMHASNSTRTRSGRPRAMNSCGACCGSGRRTPLTMRPSSHRTCTCSHSGSSSTNTTSRRQPAANEAGGWYAVSTSRHARMPRHRPRRVQVAKRGFMDLREAKLKLRLALITMISSVVICVVHFLAAAPSPLHLHWQPRVLPAGKHGQVAGCTGRGCEGQI